MAEGRDVVLSLSTCVPGVEVAQGRFPALRRFPGTIVFLLLSPELVG